MVGGAVVVVGAAGALVLGGTGAAAGDVVAGAGFVLVGARGAVGCGAAVGGGTVDRALDPGVFGCGTVVGGTAVGGVFARALEPGCPRATVTPMKEAAPVEIRTMAGVSRRRSSSARARLR